MYKVFITGPCSDAYEKSDYREQLWFDKIKEGLKISVTGDILRVRWFREKKFEGKRLYFIIDDFSQRILLIAFARKKDQERIIDEVISNMSDWFSYLRSL